MKERGDPTLPKFDPKGKLHEKHLNAILQSYAKIPNRVRALRDICILAMTANLKHSNPRIAVLSIGDIPYLLNEPKTVCHPNLRRLLYLYLEGLREVHKWDLTDIDAPLFMPIAMSATSAPEKEWISVSTIKMIHAHSKTATGLDFSRDQLVDSSLDMVDMEGLLASLRKDQDLKKNRYLAEKPTTNGQLSPFELIQSAPGINQVDTAKKFKHPGRPRKSSVDDLPKMGGGQDKSGTFPQRTKTLAPAQPRAIPTAGRSPSSTMVSNQIQKSNSYGSPPAVRLFGTYAQNDNAYSQGASSYSSPSSKPLTYGNGPSYGQLQSSRPSGPAHYERPYQRTSTGGYANGAPPPPPYQGQYSQQRSYAAPYPSSSEDYAAQNGIFGSGRSSSLSLPIPWHMDHTVSAHSPNTELAAHHLSRLAERNQKRPYYETDDDAARLLMSFTSKREQVQ